MRIVRAHVRETALREIIVAIEDAYQKLVWIGHKPMLTLVTRTDGGGAISDFDKIDVSPVIRHGRRTTMHKP